MAGALEGIAIDERCTTNLARVEHRVPLKLRAMPVASTRHPPWSESTHA
jgi:hypothetical protein